MWADVLTWTAVVVLAGVLFLLIRHGWRMQELADDEAREVERRKADTARFYLPEVSLKAFTATMTGDGTSGAADVTGDVAETQTLTVPQDTDTVVMLALRQDQTLLSADVTQASNSMARVLDEIVVGPVKAKAGAVDPVRLVAISDELGEWQPWEHEQSEPKIMGDVLAWRKWKTVRPEHVGLIAR